MYCYQEEDLPKWRLDIRKLLVLLPYDKKIGWVAQFDTILSRKATS